MKYKCYLCGRKVDTNHLMATISTNIEIYDKDCNQVVTTLLDENICGWCAHQFESLKRIIQEGLKKEEK